VARPNLRRIKLTKRSPVHRLAANARDEVRYESGMGLAVNHDPLEVLVAAGARKLQFHAVHCQYCTDIQNVRVAARRL